MSYYYELFNHPFIILMIVFLFTVSLYLVISAMREKNNLLYEMKERGQVDNRVVVKQILSMLNQSGGVLPQNKIRENLNINPEKVNTLLVDLESEGKIIRKWDLQTMTFKCKSMV